MTGRRPADASIVPGVSLDARGRARRWVVDDDAGALRELWRLPADAGRVGQRLLALGEQGLGGFVDFGEDEQGPWLLRVLPATSLERRRRERPGPWAWAEVAPIIERLLQALAAAEAASLFPGPVLPAAISVGDGGVVVPAEPLVGGMVGEAAARGGTDLDAKALLYAPPESMEAALWDAAANRYAAGVILYDLLSGTHPFGGAGLRHALDEARQAEAAPFETAIARELPPGVMSLCLRLVARDPARRPGSAAEALASLRARAAGEREPGSAPTSPRPEVEEAEVEEETPRGETEASPRRAPRERGRSSRPPQADALDLPWLARGLSRGRARFIPLALGAAAIALALAFTLDTPPDETSPTARPEIRPQPILAAATSRAQDCASCHPRQAAEWSQSVMGHSVKSPLFNALEALIEEQVGRDDDCPGGAGILRRADPRSACRARDTGLSITGSGGEHWCVNCHAAGDNLGSRMPVWEGQRTGDPRSRHPVKDLIGEVALEGIGCAFCHQVHGPVGRQGSGGYQGNPDWRSFVTGIVYASRPEDRRGKLGIANSGYLLDPAELLLQGPGGLEKAATQGGFAVHARPTDAARRYLASSDFCGSCHDVRLFGTDVIGVSKGEHFKRLRNAYSEWAAWAADERAAGREPASCQGCHMSSFPGVCVPGERPDEDPIHDGCPEGTRFEARAPGERVTGRVAQASAEATAISPHYFAGVDMPLAREIADEALAADGLDAAGIPLSAKRRRDLLLRASMELSLGEAQRSGASLSIPVLVENVGAGHKVPAGFSQEREIWVHLRVEDGQGRVVYEVGRVERNDEDLHDKVFLRVNTDPGRIDGQGRPVGLFGADIRDGPDVPEWSPPPDVGGDRFVGRGLINFQNGFLRCVRCIGLVGPNGECEAPVNGFFGDHRAARFADGDYDLDTGECRSNLSGRAALLETYFPVGSLDADRGLPKGPDAIIDTRSLLPGRRVRYTYQLSTQGRPGPFQVTARLMFRSFPPFLVRAFAEYEAAQAARGKRPSGPLVTFDMLERLERVVVDRASLVVP
ncbi:MAG: hypothetical protein R3B72_33290 [Polyangiaceae bacterium]